MKHKKKPTLTQALIPIIFMLVLLGVGYGYFKFRVEPILIISALVAGIVALKLGYNWNDLQSSIIEKISKAMPAILILWSVGFFIGSLMFAGTVPMIIYYGIQILNPKFLLVTAFIITALLSTVTGTSWGAAGTMGVAIMGIAGGLGVSLPAAAGAIVSGAYFGDKLSPLSDTTNLAPISAGSELYEHIKHMLYTTIPASIVAIIVYLIVGFKSAGSAATPEKVTTMISQMDNLFNWNWLLILPILMIIFGSIKKWPAVPVMIGTSLFSILLGVFIQGFSFKDGFFSLVKGFNVSMTGTNLEVIWDVTRLINRGGINSMLGTTVLVFAAMAFAGIISSTGMLTVVLHTILARVKTNSGVVLSTIASCITIAFMTGSSYLSIIIPGEMFRKIYVEKGLHPKNLSRTLEDSGTVFVPLVPWSAAGAYMAATLGVPTIQYLPWAILNYAGIFFAILLAITGIGIAKMSADEKKKHLALLDDELPTESV